MKYPERLKKNGTIGFIAPSFGCTTEPYKSCLESAIQYFSKEGYRTVLGPNCHRDDGVGKSSSPENCAEEINSFMTGDFTDIIISCGGGETMCEDLPFIDFESISASKPKWFMGYSDNTNLTFTLPTICDIAAVYGPCAPSFGTYPLHESLHDALGILTGKISSVHNYDRWESEGLRNEENPFLPYNTTEEFDMKIFESEKGQASFKGRLIGGCLDCLVTLCGTRFDKVTEFCKRYQEDGIIWFIEACDLNMMGIRRALWQLEQAGWFGYVKGFLIGRPAHYDEVYCGMDRFVAVRGILEKYNVPIVMDVDIGHLPPMMPLISGSYAEVTAFDNKLDIDMKLI